MMKRVFVSELFYYSKALKTSKYNDCYDEILYGIQGRGGVIIPTNFSHSRANYELFLVMYEDNDNNGKIKEYLKKSI